MSEHAASCLTCRSAELYHLYGRAVDEGDIEALRDLATPDISITRGDRPAEHGLETYLDVYRAHVALEIPVCRHVITNVVARKEGEQVLTHAYFEATMLETTETRVVLGTYDDVHVEHEGRLKIAHKRLTVQRVLKLPVAEGQEAHFSRF